MGGSSIFDALEQGRQRAKNDVIAYVHDDTRLIEPASFSEQAVAAFGKRPRLGMVGAYGREDGARVLPWWNCPKRWAGHYMQRRNGKPVYRYACGSRMVFTNERVRVWRGWKKVGFVDGFCLIEHRRRMNVPWDTQSFPGQWHGYDVDRCMQAHQKGLDVMVGPWLFMHDNAGHAGYKGEPSREVADAAWLSDLRVVNQALSIKRGAPMRVLMTARYTVKQQPIGGVQSWIETVKQSLRSMGHEVMTWGRKESHPRGRFDLGVIAHWGEAGRLPEQCDRTVSVSHGIIAPEKPGPADAVFFTSEEVREHWGVDGQILRQPMDLLFWSPAPSRRELLTRFSYRGGLEFVPGLASELGLKYRHLRNANPRGVRDVLRQSACVLATGRAALEAMACGAPVVICDHRHPYQKALLDPDAFGSMHRNYSGRGGITPSPENVQSAIRHAMKYGSMRAFVEEHHGAANVTRQLLGDA